MGRKRTTAQCPVTGLSVFNKTCNCRVCLDARSTEQRAMRKRRPDFVKRMNLRAYGLTLEQFEIMMRNQKGVCAVCHQPELGRNQHGVMALAVDHDHNTGRVRALLCHRCNRALGLLGDDPDRVQALADYRRMN